jgi:formylglycine-generating enzyme required for sulfatase activity
VVRGASHDDPPETLRVTSRRFYSYDGAHRGLARGHHHVGFRCATSEDLGGY